MATFKGAVLNCNECGKEFKVPPVRKDTAKYCSKECADVHRQDGRRKEKLERFCPLCGKSFLIYACHAERRTYCSYECADAAAAHAAPPDHHFYTRSFWRNLRGSVLERDEYACKKCGNDTEGLHVHHVVSRFLGGEDEESNLITLCNSCHKKSHAYES